MTRHRARPQIEATIAPENKARLDALAKIRDLPPSRVLDDLMRRGFAAIPEDERAAVAASLSAVPTRRG